MSSKEVRLEKIMENKITNCKDRQNADYMVCPAKNKGNANISPRKVCTKAPVYLYNSEKEGTKSKKEKITNHKECISENFPFFTCD